MHRNIINDPKGIAFSTLSKNSNKISSTRKGRTVHDHSSSFSLKNQPSFLANRIFSGTVTQKVGESNNNTTRREMQNNSMALPVAGAPHSNNFSKLIKYGNDNEKGVS